MKNFVFICNASKKEGFGHFIRCFNIACSLKKVNSDLRIYFDGNYDLFALKKIRQNNFCSVEINNRDNLYKQSIVIFDSYLHNQKKINEISAKSLISIKIDDFNLYDLSNVDCVINFRLNAEYENYKSKKSLLGLKYYPAPIELIDLRKKNISEFKNNKEIKNEKILIFIGGNDKFDIGERIIIESDKYLSNKEFLWIKNNICRKSLDLKNNVLSIYNLQENISTILKSVDSVICGGGLMKYDCGFSLIPCGSISQNFEQETDSKILESKNIIFNFGMHDDLSSNLLEKSITKFLDISFQKSLKNNLIDIFFSESNYSLAKEIISLYP